MKAHELARTLLEGPDEQVMYYDGDELLYVQAVAYRHHPEVIKQARSLLQDGRIVREDLKFTESKFIQLLP